MKYLVTDGDGSDEKFRTLKEAQECADSWIQDCLIADEWDESVQNIRISKIIAESREGVITHREDVDVDEDGWGPDGEIWPVGCETKRNYEMQSVEESSETEEYF